MKFLKKYRKPICFYTLLLIACVCWIIYYTDGKPFVFQNTEPQSSEPPVPVAEPPVPIPAYIVKVVNRTASGNFEGYGVAVDYKGTKFIISSRMLFLDADRVTVGGETASVVAGNAESDLVALNVFFESDRPYIKLIPYENTDLGILTTDPGILTTTDTRTPVVMVESELRRECWMALRGVPAGSEGAPVTHEGILVGLMLGFSKNGTAIAANNGALVKFGE